MTVSKDYNKHVYEGNGLTVDWPYDFDLPITAAGTPDTSLIHVFRTNLRGEVTEVTAFSVDAETGTLTYPTSGSPLETGEKLTILRLLDVRQQFFDPSNQANLYPETLEDNTDRLVMMIQQIDEEVGRAVTMGEGYEGEEVTAEGLLEARDIAISAAETAEGYAAQLPAIADELGVNLVADEADLRAKLAAIGASNASLVIATTIPIAADLTIPSNVALSFKRAGQLQPAVGTTLTINGAIDAGLWQIFGGEGEVIGSPQISVFYPEWFGAIGNGIADDYAASQKALAFPCVEFSAGKTYRIVNATYAAGATIFEQRANAVANNTLYPLVSSLDEARIIVNGTVQAVSELGDLFKLLGSRSVICGTGWVKGNGVVNDYNSGQVGAEPLNQWYAAQVNLAGVECACMGLHFDKMMAVSLNMTGNRCRAADNTFMGGVTVFGTGTVVQHIHIAEGVEGAIVSNNTFSINADNETCYSAIFAVGLNPVITDNMIYDAMSHGVYNYSTGAIITRNQIIRCKGNGIQSFGLNCTISENYIADIVAGGGIGLQHCDNTRVINNTILGIGGTGIHVGSYYTVTAESPALKNIQITGNIVSLSSISDSSVIQIVSKQSVENLLITGNTLQSAGTDSQVNGALRIEAKADYPDKFIKDFIVSNNIIGGVPGYAIRITRGLRGKVSDNIIKNVNETLGEVAIYLNTGTMNIMINNNYIYDNRITKKTKYAVYAAPDVVGCTAEYNTCELLNSGTFYIITRNGTENRGNRLNNGNATGTFSTSLAATFTVTNEQAMSSAYQRCLLYPLNRDAVMLQNSAQALYVSSISGTNITLTTANSTALTITTAQFMYEILN